MRPERKTSAKMTCSHCGYPSLTWAEARQSFGVMIRYGLTPEAAKNLSPRCRRCVAAIARGRRATSKPRITPDQ
jgi:hypothetical protein